MKLIAVLSSLFVIIAGFVVMLHGLSLIESGDYASGSAYVVGGVFIMLLGAIILPRMRARSSWSS